MKGWKRYVFALLILLLVLALAGCKKRYTREDMKEYAREQLRNKYGEEFEIRGEVFKVSGSCYEANVSPVNNPDIIFEVSYNAAGSPYNFDYYIESIIGAQYKALVEEEIKEMPYDYVLRVRVPREKREIPLTDISMTIEEFNDATEEKYRSPDYSLYISKNVLAESDEYIYNLLISIIEIEDPPNPHLRVLFLEDEDLKLVKAELSERYDLDGTTKSNLYDEYDGTFLDAKKGFLLFVGGTVQEEPLDYEEFVEKMEVIREDVKHW